MWLLWFIIDFRGNKREDVRFLDTLGTSRFVPSMLINWQFRYCKLLLCLISQSNLVCILRNQMLRYWYSFTWLFLRLVWCFNYQDYVTRCFIYCVWGNLTKDKWLLIILTNHSWIAWLVWSEIKEIHLSVLCICINSFILKPHHLQLTRSFDGIANDIRIRY